MVPSGTIQCAKFGQFLSWPATLAPKPSHRKESNVWMPCDVQSWASFYSDLPHWRQNTQNNRTSVNADCWPEEVRKVDKSSPAMSSKPRAVAMCWMNLMLAKLASEHWLNPCAHSLGECAENRVDLGMKIHTIKNHPRDPKGNKSILWRYSYLGNALDIWSYLCVYIQRKFRSQAFDNMDRWKAESGRVREEREEKRRSKKKKSEERRSRCAKR